MRRHLVTLGTLAVAALCCGAMSIGASPTITDSLILGYASGAARINGNELKTAAWPTGHSVVFTGTPNVTLDASSCTGLPCTISGATISEWTGGTIKFTAIPSTITGGYTVSVTTPEGTSNAVTIETYAITRYYLPAPTDVNLTAVSRLLVDGFEYGCSGGEPCSLASSTFTRDQWTGTTTSGGTIQNDFASSAWNGDAGNNWAMHTSGGTAYRYKTITGTKEVSAHFEFCPQSTPGAARTVVAFRNAGSSADQAFVTFGTDNILRAYYGSTSNAYGASSVLTNGTCYEVALLQDADRDTAGCARVAMYVDGTSVGDSEICGLTIANVDTFRLGAIDGTIDTAFDNVVLSGGFDESVIYLRLADIHPDQDSSPNAWSANRTTPQRSGCNAGTEFDCINDMAPSGQCNNDATLACQTGSVAECGVSTNCNYVTSAPLESVDDNDSAVSSTNSASDEEEFRLTDITLGTDPLEKIAAGGAVNLTCWVREQNSNSATKNFCFAVSNGSTARCNGSGTNINGYGASSYVPISQLYTTDSTSATGCSARPSATCAGGTRSGRSCNNDVDCPGSTCTCGDEDTNCPPSPCWNETSLDGLYLRLQNPSAASTDTRVRATECHAEVEITKRLPSVTSNPLPLAGAFDSTGNLYIGGEFTNNIYKIADGAGMDALASVIPVPAPATGLFVFNGGRTNTTMLWDDADYAQNAGVDEIWMTQGGALNYSDSSAATEHNASRIIQYKPATGAFRCYTLPDTNAALSAIYRESASSVWAIGYGGIPSDWTSTGSVPFWGGGDLWHFDPSAFSDTQASCLIDGSTPYVVGECGSSPCYERIPLPTRTPPIAAGEVTMVGGKVYVGDAFGGGSRGTDVVAYDPTPGTWTTYTLPPSATAARTWFRKSHENMQWFESLQANLGSSIGFVSTIGSTIWLPEFNANRLSSLNTSTGAIASYDLPGYQWEQPQTSDVDGSILWMSTGDESTRTYAWTGTNSDGTKDSTNANLTCSNWNSVSPFSGGLIGDTTATDATWTDYGTYGSCFAPPRRLYCFEQGLGANKRVFLSSRPYDGKLGTTTGADALCQTLAGEAGMGSSTWKAWLSTTATDASARLDQLEASYDYLLVDNTKVADGWADLTDGTLDHAINVDENGTKGGGRVYRIDTSASPPTIQGFELITDYDEDAVGGITGLVKDPTTSGRFCALAQSVTDTKPIYCFQQQPPPATYTFTPTRTSTPTPTSTATPVYYENGILNLAFQSSNGTSSLYGASTQSSASTTEVRRSIWPPTSYRATDLYASCTSADASRSTTFTLRNDGADVSGAACTMAAGATTCSATGFASDYSSSRELAIRSALSSSGGTARRCTVGVSYKANGGVGEADAIIFGGGDARALTATSPTPTTYYCGTCKVNATCDAQYSCAGTTKLNAGLIIPKACTLSGLTIIADSGIGSGNTETYSIEKSGPNGTPSPTPDLSTSITNTGFQNSDNICTVNCSVSAGDRLFLRNDVLGTTAGGNKYRRWAISCDGAGQFVVGGVTTTSATAVYVGQNNSATASDVATVAPRAFTARSLYVQSVNALTGGAATVTLYKGATAGTMAATALTCTTVSNGTSFCPNGTHCCRDITNNVSVSAGEFWVLRESAAGSTTNANLLMSFEQSNGN